ncbi:unnamed protein product [Arabis nemorensis]|uniref:Uncharacterized protein n=1 Tax=Arabis nemorensis TaxID=586526 RepID=A0A565BIJ8_9BRAS|nr:unnamed protein product [Arabis nemorensis]
MTTSSWDKNRYDVKGFVLAIHLFLLSAIPTFGEKFATKLEGSEEEVPLCLRWGRTDCPRTSSIMQIEKEGGVMVNVIVGDLKYYSHLVFPTHDDDTGLMELVDIIMKGKFRMKASYWIAGSVNIDDICQGIEETYNTATQIVRDLMQEQKKQTKKHQMTQDEKLDRIITLLENLGLRIARIEQFLGIKNEQTESEKQENETQEEDTQQKEPETQEDTENQEKERVDLALMMFNKRMEQNPDLFRKGGFIFQPSFFTLIDEQFPVFVDEMERFEFETKGIRTEDKSRQGISSIGCSNSDLYNNVSILCRCWISSLSVMDLDRILRADANCPKPVSSSSLGIDTCSAILSDLSGIHISRKMVAHSFRLVSVEGNSRRFNLQLREGERSPIDPPMWLDANADGGEYFYVIHDGVGRVYSCWSDIGVVPEDVIPDESFPDIFYELDKSFMNTVLLLHPRIVDQTSLDTSLNDPFIPQQNLDLLMATLRMYDFFQEVSDESSDEEDNENHSPAPAPESSSQVLVQAVQLSELLRE